MASHHDSHNRHPDHAGQDVSSEFPDPIYILFHAIENLSQRRILVISRGENVQPTNQSYANPEDHFLAYDKPN